LPIYKTLSMCGEYTVRVFDLRTIGPSDPVTGLVLGGNKSLLFNVEQTFTIAGPVRLLLFYDACQVRDEGQRFAWQETVQQIVPTAGTILVDPLSRPILSDP